MDPRTWFKDLTPYFLYLVLIATIGPMLFGFHLAELNTPQEVLTCKKKSLFDTAEGSSALPQCIPMNATELGVVSSMFTLGGFIGAMAGGPAGNKYGRLRTMMGTIFFFVLGPIFEALAPNIGVLALGRLISGFGAGASVVVVPIYISEISPPEEKGFFGSLTQVMVNGGIFTTQLMGYLLSYGQMWRLVLALGGAIGALGGIGLLFSAESPKWTAEQGKSSQAKKTLVKIRGDKFDVESEFASWGYHSNDSVADEEETLLNNSDEGSGASIASGKGRRENLSMWQAIKQPESRTAIIGVVVVMIAQQLTGINSIIMYGVALLADLLKSNAALLNLLVSLLNICVTLGCAPLVDKLGRKSCLLTSIAGMGISSLLLGIGIRNGISVLSAIAVLCFVGSFGIGLGPIPFILSAELVNQEAVGATQGWALGANWISTFIVAQFFPMVNDYLGKGKVYFIFAGLALFFWLFIGWWVPETKGKKNADEVWGRVAVSSERED